MSYANNVVISSCVEDGSVKFWQPSTKHLENMIKPFSEDKHDGPTKLFSVDTPFFQQIWVASSINGRINIYRAKSFQLLTSIKNNSLIGMSGMAVYKDQVWIAVEGKIYFLSIEKGEVLGCFQAHNTGTCPFPVYFFFYEIIDPSFLLLPRENAFGP